MEDWVQRALAKWPDVPALYGWLSLTRRGVWRIKGEDITRPQIVATLNANYAADERGCWYFQNGPQRGYVALDYAPLVLRVADDGDGDADGVGNGAGTLVAHTGATVAELRGVYLDEEGSLLFATDQGAGLLAQEELDWALRRLVTIDGGTAQADDSGDGSASDNSGHGTGAEDGGSEGEDAAAHSGAEAADGDDEDGGMRPVDEAALAAALALPSGSRTSLRLRIGDALLIVQRLDAASAPATLGFVREPAPAPAPG